MFEAQELGLAPESSDLSGSPFDSYHLVIMSNLPHILISGSEHATGPASFHALSSIAVDPDASGLSRWLTQRPHQESWDAMNLRQDQFDFKVVDNGKRAV